MKPLALRARSFKPDKTCTPARLSNSTLFSQDVKNYVRLRLSGLCIIVLSIISCFSDAQSGVLRVWNVSKTTPVENIRLKKTGFHAICLVPRTKSRTKPESNSWNSHISSTSIVQDPPSSPNSDSFVLPPADLLCTFIDGGVGLYNLDKRKWSFLQPMVRNFITCTIH